MTIEDFAFQQHLDLDEFIAMLRSHLGLQVEATTKFDDIPRNYYGQIGIIAWSLTEG